MNISRSSVILEHVKFHACHGVLPQERLTGANFYVTLEAETDFHHAMRTDELTGTVSYADLYEMVRKEMQQPSQLIEHVAERILRRIFDECPAISRIRLKLTKENPPMHADCREAGICVEAER